jgi:hypothetical protein
MEKKEKTQKNPRGAGRKKHQPTENLRAQISALVAFGVPHERIAKFIKIDYNTLTKYYKEELDTASDKRNVEVSGFLFHAASGLAIADGASYADCLKAAMFWLKTRAGWREKDREEDTRSEPISITITRATSADQS